MSSELVKWRPEKLETRVDRWRRQRIEHGSPVTEVLNPPRETRVPQRWARPDSAPLLTTETVADLPRICAMTKKLWCARYFRADHFSEFRYIRSVIPDGRIAETLYVPENWRVLPPSFATGTEDCPRCGAYTPDDARGSVWCTACHSWVCYGLTSRDGYFVCSCGYQGQLQNSVLNRYRRGFSRRTEI
jgi:hypothetical protein